MKGTKKFVQRDFFNNFNTLAVRAVGTSIPYTDISLRGGGGAELRNSNSCRVTPQHKCIQGDISVSGAT